jgi:lipopolysaccharide export system permease protein
MQFLWKHIDDLVGKGLEWIVIAKLLVYVSASLVPMALPLAILLSSLMTFGNLGEHYELVAFKSAGISLKQLLKPLGVLVIGLSVVAYLFSNYWLPIANLKSKSLLYDVKQQKPTMDIKPGIFSSELNDYTIKVKNKKVINGIEHLYDVFIYKHKNLDGNRSVTVAEEGQMTVSDDKRYMVLTLRNGANYEESKVPYQDNKFPHQRTLFTENVVRFDLSQFQLNRTDEELFKSNYKMLNLRQLDESIDTLSKMRQEAFTNYVSGVKKSYMYNNTLPQAKAKQRNSPISFIYDSLLGSFDVNRQKQIYNTAINLSRNSKSRLESIEENLYNRDKFIRYHKIYWHKKLTLSFACFVLFLIGAPLGAIIRKGGLGMPMVISVAFFITYHMISVTGEKMAKEGAIPVYQGMWLASVILLPIGLLITYRATTDSSLFQMETYLKGWQKLKKITSPKS